MHIDNRKAILMMRISTHDLMIEKGRHEKIPPDRRKCKICPNEIEDENHVIFDCPAYNKLREAFYKATDINLNNIDIDILFSSDDTTDDTAIRCIGNLCSQIFKLRKELIKALENLGITLL